MEKFSIAVPEECSILAIYNAIAAVAGRDPKVCRYDCRCVWVAENIFQAFSAYMSGIGKKDSIGMYWMLYGPKVNENLKPGEVRIEDGFFTN